MEVRKIKLSEIDISEGTQSRVEINMSVVEEYKTALLNEAKFPPIKVMFDSVKYHIIDGWHRVIAHKLLLMSLIEAEIELGTKRDAILRSLSANDSHGLRRSNADKRKAVWTLLEDPEWSQWSNYQIAETCKVVESFARNIRNEHQEFILRLKRSIESEKQEYQRQIERGEIREISEEEAEEIYRARQATIKPTTRKFIHPKTGKETTMNVSNIGKKKVEEPILINIISMDSEKNNLFLELNPILKRYSDSEHPEIREIVYQIYEVLK